MIQGRDGQTPWYLNNKILIEDMHGPYSEHCSPMTFTYTTRDEEETRSINSTHSHYTVQRINQLRPKAKIIITKPTKNQGPSSAQPKASQTQTSTIETSPTRSPQKVVNQTLEYQKSKPTAFNWNKFKFICGADQIVLGENGCLCPGVCRWKAQWTKNQCKNDYSSFKKILNEQPKKEYLVQIEKDLLRTYPQCPTFACNAEFHRMLKHVLVAYSIYDVDLGYVQGLNMIAGVLLYHIKNPEQTFWALVQTMEDQELRLLYLDGFKHLKAHIERMLKIIQSKVADLHALMEELDIIPECFLNGWFLSLMSNCIPIEYMPEVIDRFREQGWNFIYKLIVSYLRFLKERLMLSGDQAEFLQYLSTQAGRELGTEWQKLIVGSGKVIL